MSRSLVRTRAAFSKMHAQDLIERCFAPRPVFRMGYDHHVKAYRRTLGEAAFTRHTRDPQFAYAYDARVAFERGRPLPAWKECA